MVSGSALDRPQRFVVVFCFSLADIADWSMEELVAVEASSHLGFQGSTGDEDLKRSP